jgi:hypothetical protein
MRHQAQHLAHRAECSLTVFELSSPFRGIETRGAPELIVGDVTDARRAIASRYVGPEGGVRFAARRNPVGTVVRLRLDEVLHQAPLQALGRAGAPGSTVAAWLPSRIVS